MSTEYGRIGKQVENDFFNNNGIYSPQDIYELDLENKWSTFGQLELIETVNASGVSSFDFSDLKDYKIHFMTVNDCTNNSASKGVAFRLYEAGVLESSSVYDTMRQFTDTTGTFSENRSSSNSAIRFSSNTNIGSLARNNINGYLYFFNLLDSSKYSFTIQHSSAYSNSDRGEFIFGSNLLPQKSTVNKIQVLAFDVGTITGNFSLYGIRTES